MTNQPTDGRTDRRADGQTDGQTEDASKKERSCFSQRTMADVRGARISAFRTDAAPGLEPYGRTQRRTERTERKLFIIFDCCCYTGLRADREMIKKLGRYQENRGRNNPREIKK